MKDRLKNNWAFLFVFVLFIIQLIVFAITGSDSYIAIHDNLDLFVAQLQMLKNTNSFFSHDTLIPMLGGISRDTLGSQFSLYNILYYIFPSFLAYIIAYFLKIIIGFISFQILGKEVYGEKYNKYQLLFITIGMGYGMIPVFPAYGIAFTSIPLLIYIFIKIYKKPTFKFYLALFLYPLLSYFSYFGFFILAYCVCAVIIIWFINKKMPKQMIVAIFVLAGGYILFEYRLFHEMLFTNKETIRVLMVNDDLGFTGVLMKMIEAFVNPIFHAQDSHLYLILPVTVVAGFWINYLYIRKKEYNKIWKEPFNYVFIFIIFNCVIAGLYHCEYVRKILELLLPPLKGFQFDRTIYFNPFLWCVLLFLVLKKLYDLKILKYQRLANIIAMAAVCVIMFFPQTYNDFFSTCRGTLYEAIKGVKPSCLSYKEFYSEDLFAEIRQDINYEGEWAIAYGLHPAVLEYNDIATLDGYLGFYTTEYHEKFHELIAPALEGNPWAKDYFENWGARAYLFSGSGENIPSPYREIELKDHRLMINPETFRELGGRYIFSRIEIDNMDELGLTLKGIYEKNTSPYRIYVYEA